MLEELTKYRPELATLALVLSLASAAVWGGRAFFEVEILKASLQKQQLKQAPLNDSVCQGLGLPKEYCSGLR